jgi:hypothetical protein
LSFVSCLFSFILLRSNPILRTHKRSRRLVAIQWKRQRRKWQWQQWNREWCDVDDRSIWCGE